MNNFDEKVNEILAGVFFGKTGVGKANIQIKKLISETIGERKSVEELVTPDAMTDLASKVCFKEGYNTKVKELRHAFNLKGE